MDEDTDQLSSEPKSVEPFGDNTLALPISPASRPCNRRRSKGVLFQGGPTDMSILELLQQIVKEPAPRLISSERDESKFPKAAGEFVDACLTKEQEDRRTPAALLKYEWIEQTLASKVDMRNWAESLDVDI
ncbi:hypothetical protein BDP27DRAFT_1416204 [Rhodocollybia butyracea]|uniref:Uncharacterized protein n=1 Tax=Rhodocollybia butyracea TaxID=206335 RepID=A0A9P5Q2J6_9AGAR|nr:hypothetical protein BDP27DRAFT_1416204 [Rhodocollybia butyracea]